MRSALILLTFIAATSAACDRISLPNWSGPPPTTLEPEDGYLPEVVDSRPLVARLTDLSVDATPGGIIVVARAMPPFQGYWAPGLVPVTGEDVPADTLIYEFRALPPVTPALRGPERSRAIEAGTFVSDFQLAGIRRVTVRAAGNSLTRSR